MNSISNLFVILFFVFLIPSCKYDQKLSYRLCGKNQNFEKRKFEFLNSKPFLELRYYKNENNFQKAEMLVNHQIFKDILYHFISRDSVSMIPCGYILFLNDFIEFHSDVQDSDVKAITIITTDKDYKSHSDFKFYHNFFLRNSTNKNFNNIQELFCEGNTINDKYIKLTSNNLIPFLKGKKSTALVVFDLRAFGHPIKNLQTVNNFLSTYNSYLKNKEIEILK